MLELSPYLEDEAVNNRWTICGKVVVGNPNGSLGHLIPGPGFCFFHAKEETH